MCQVSGRYSKLLQTYNLMSEIDLLETAGFVYKFVKNICRLGTEHSVSAYRPHQCSADTGADKWKSYTCTIEQLRRYIWPTFPLIFLCGFHTRCLPTSSIPWCKKFKTNQKLKSRGYLTFRLDSKINSSASVDMHKEAISKHAEMIVQPTGPFCS